MVSADTRSLLHLGKYIKVSVQMKPGYCSERGS